MNQQNTSANNQGDERSRDLKTQKSPRSPAENVSFGIALAVLLGVAGLVGYVWLSKHSQDPPDVVISRPEAIRESSGQYYVPFEVKNVGGGTAESVQVLAELEINGEVVESGEQQFDFLSGDEIEEGAFVFTQDPRAGELTIRVGSYKLP